MQADFSRVRFNAVRHYSSVRQQQGRVLLDADWNEQLDIHARRAELETIDVIGPTGAPLHPATAPSHFQIVPKGTDFQIAPGRYYVDGILCENEPSPQATGSEQPHLPKGSAIVQLADGTVQALPAPEGTYIAYLDVWQRHITDLDDPDLREPALGDVDTTTRTQTIWQVRLLEVPANTTCAANPAAWNSLVSAASGALRAQARPAPNETNQCAVPPGGGYRRLENQLYRVEIHKPGPLGTATFKWSRDNGSVAARWTKKQGNELTISRPSRDSVLGFEGRPYIELLDDARELQRKPGTLVQLSRSDGAVLTIDPATRSGPVELADFPGTPKVRRWDSPGELTVEVPSGNDGWIVLEDGVEVRFEPGHYQTGDYWTIPARTATGEVIWPRSNGSPAILPRQGVSHHFARLAIVTSAANGQLTVHDCRNLFTSLTELTHLVYVGGDGQETLPGESLDGDLEVAVINGKAPVPNAAVQFRFITSAGDGTLTAGGQSGPRVTAITDSRGIARSSWRPDSIQPSQRVEAVLLDSAGTVIGVPIHFHANLSTARQVAYDRAGCPAMPPNVATVQHAIDFLCHKGHGAGCCVTVGKGGEYERLDEALDDLLKRQELVDICLCLLAGDHELRDGLTVSPNSDKPLHIRLAGCGPATRLRTRNPLEFKALATFGLCDLTLMGEGLPALLTLHDCKQIQLSSCRIDLQGSQNGPNVQIRAAASVLVYRCEIINANRDTGMGLMIEDNQADVKLFGNDINATVALYGQAQAQVSEVDLRSLRSSSHRVIFNGERSLWISDNRLGGVTAGEENVKRIKSAAEASGGSVQLLTHRSAQITNNRFHMKGNTILAEHVVLSGNSFESNDGLLAAVLSQCSAIVGNVVTMPKVGCTISAFGTIQEAANLMKVMTYTV